MSSLSGTTFSPSVASITAEADDAMGSSLTAQLDEHLNHVISRVMHSVGVSALIGGLFSAVGLAGGALYGAVSSLSSVTVEWICDKAGCLQDNTTGKSLRNVISLIVSIVAGCLALAATGFAWAPGAIVAIEVGSRGLFLLGTTAFCCLLTYGLSRMDAVGDRRTRPV